VYVMFCTNLVFVDIFFTNALFSFWAFQVTLSDVIMTRVFNSGRLGVNTPKNFSPYAQILRRGCHDVQIYLLLITFICP